VNILLFLDRRRGMISVIPMGLLVIEGWGSRVGVANGSKLEIDVNGEVIRAHTWEVTPLRHSHVGAK